VGTELSRSSWLTITGNGEVELCFCGYMEKELVVSIGGEATFRLNSGCHNAVWSGSGATAMDLSSSKFAVHISPKGKDGGLSGYLAEVLHSVPSIVTAKATAGDSSCMGNMKDSYGVLLAKLSFHSETCWSSFIGDGAW
jgi:hypothetical protein